MQSWIITFDLSSPLDDIGSGRDPIFLGNQRVRNNLAKAASAKPAT
jgi:hypothetical protein